VSERNREDPDSLLHSAIDPGLRTTSDTGVCAQRQKMRLRRRVNRVCR
jgi:hypothetical protein